MASTTVAVRLPNEVLEELQKKAAAQNKKVSDYVRELIVSDLHGKGPTTNGDSNAKVIEYLEGFGGVLMGILFETVSGRYFAEMATNYGTDMESLLREGKPMDKEAKATLMGQFEAAAMQIAQETWARVLRLENPVQ
jgi:hypothetical protein